MLKLLIISWKNLLRVFEKHKYKILRRKGSHYFVESYSGKNSTVVPLHKNEDLGKGLLKSILNDLELSVEKLVEMMGK